jgi:cysteine-rich repeat protein
MTASFKTDTNNPYTLSSCIATIRNESGGFVSAQAITATLINSGQEVNCTVDSSLSGVTSNGIYRVTVNATDSQGYTLETSELVFFNCNDLSSSGSTWDCALADFDVDGYTEGTNLSFNYSNDQGGFQNFACDSCPGETNSGKDADGDGYDNVCDPICGDGFVEGNEECDDGNLEDGDGCSSKCTLEVVEEIRRAGRREEIEISLEKEIINIDLFQGQEKKIDVIIRNNEPETININLKDLDLEDLLIRISETSFFLRPYQEKKISVTFRADDYLTPGLYIEKMLIRAGKSEKVVTFHIDVQSEEVLFDVSINIPKDPAIYYPGDSIVAYILFYNLGKEGETKVEVEYTVENEEGDIILGEKEILLIKDSMDLLKTFDLPEDLKTGHYFFYVKATYDDKTAVASKAFGVVRPSIISEILDYINKVLKENEEIIEKAIICLIALYLIISILRALSAKGFFGVIGKRFLFGAGKRRAAKEAAKTLKAKAKAGKEQDKERIRFWHTHNQNN